jgi:GntR family transcriptional regulator, transcriptional repressor for pyruvate dehydrogenase complex
MISRSESVALGLPVRPLEKVHRGRVAQAVFEQLLSRIVDDAFIKGAPLPSERHLCAELGVSRTAVREALVRLAQLNLIEIRHGGETRILDYKRTAGLDLLPALLESRTRKDLEVVQSGLEMRAVLAPDIARLAAKRAWPGDLHELEKVVSEMRATRDLAELQQLSLRFWAALVHGSGNIAYQLAFNSLRAGMAKMAEKMRYAQHEELRDTDGYAAILRAVKAKDARAAEKAARDHIALGTELRSIYDTRKRKK